MDSALGQCGSLLTRHRSRDYTQCTRVQNSQLRHFRFGSQHADPGACAQLKCSSEHRSLQFQKIDGCKSSGSTAAMRGICKAKPSEGKSPEHIMARQSFTNSQHLAALNIALPPSNCVGSVNPSNCNHGILLCTAQRGKRVATFYANLSTTHICSVKHQQPYPISKSSCGVSLLVKRGCATTRRLRTTVEFPRTTASHSRPLKPCKPGGCPRKQQHQNSRLQHHPRPPRPHNSLRRTTT